jgi:hypothetical protein
MAINSAMLLAEENRQLRAENERQKKRVKRRSYIATGGVLTVQEGLDLSQIANTEPESRVANQEAIVKTRAPHTCSLCRSQSHTTRIYLTKQISN